MVDDCSTDNTLNTIKSIKSKNIKIIENQLNMGKGYSLRTGINACNGDVVLITDADLSANITEFKKLIQNLKKAIHSL